MLATVRPAATRPGVAKASAPRSVTAFVVLQIVVSSLEFNKLGLARDGVDVERLLLLTPFHFVVGPAMLLLAEVRKALWRPELAGMAFWFAWALASITWSVDPFQTGMRVLGAFSIWVVAVWATQRYGFGYYARLFVIAAGSTVAVGLAADLLGLFGDDTQRWSGLTNATNRLAALAGLVCVLAFAVARRGRSWPLCGIAALSALALLGTGSRAGVGFTGLAIGLQFVSGGRTSAKRLGRITGAMGATGVVGLMLALAPSAQDLQDGRSIETLTGRQGIWAESLSFFAEQPFVGYGGMAEQVLWTESWLRGAVAFEAFHSHNLILALLVTTGVVGLVLFSIGLIGTIRSLAKRSDLGSMRVDAAAILIVLLGMSLTEASFEGPSPLFGALGTAMLVASSRPGDAKRTAWSD